MACTAASASAVKPWTWRGATACGSDLARRASVADTTPRGWHGLAWPAVHGGDAGRVGSEGRYRAPGVGPFEEVGPHVARHGRQRGRIVRGGPCVTVGPARVRRPRGGVLKGMDATGYVPVRTARATLARVREARGQPDRATLDRPAA